MADVPRYRTLTEHEVYTAQLHDFMRKYSPDVVDAALLGIYWGIAKNPDAYPRTTWNLRQAKSRSFGTIPAFRVFFQIQDADVVLLLWIEEVGVIEETNQ